MYYVLIKKSKNPFKKFTAYIFDSKNYIKKLHFGSSLHSDYTKHNDDERKERYIQRHMKNEDWTNPLTSGFWSRWLLWNKPTLKKSAEDIKNNFNIKIHFV